jgi:hypothetical protein
MLYKDLGDMDQEALVYVKLGDSYSMSIMMELHSMTVAEEYYLQACIDSFIRKNYALMRFCRLSQ